jgi:MerR family mercuric resistance operon transcriptional regulator
VTDGGRTTSGLTIGELAARSGCTPEAIRYYEREGVVPRPARAGSGRYRRYTDADVERFAFLRRARELGFSLAEVQALLAFSVGDPGRSCSDVDALARAHLRQVDAKLTQLTALRDALAGVIDQCRSGSAVADCRILGALCGGATTEADAGVIRVV